MTVAAQPNHPGSSTTQPDEHPSRVSTPESTEERPSTLFPSIDDALLRDLAWVAQEVVGDLPGRTRRQGEALLASRPMQRLRAVWQKDWERGGDEMEAAHDDAVVKALRARDAATATLRSHQRIVHDVVACLNGVGIHGEDTLGTGWRWPGQAVLQLVAERDETRAELAHVRSVLDGTNTRWEQAIAEADRLRAVGDVVTLAHHEGVVRDLTAEVERLRAALRAKESWIKGAKLDLAAQPTLPDVGPVTRNGDELHIDTPGGSALTWWPETLDNREAQALETLAAIREARAFLAAEAADTSSDDEQDEVDLVRDEISNMMVTEDDVRRAIAALDAHRAARTSREQNRG